MANLTTVSPWPPVPNQSHPPVDKTSSPLFTKEWYLFFQALAGGNSSAAASGPGGGAGGGSDVNTGLPFEVARDQWAALTLNRVEAIYSLLTNQVILSPSSGSGGSGYAPGDIVSVAGGGPLGYLQIFTVDGSGAVLTFGVIVGGDMYIDGPSDVATTAITGSGTNFVVNIEGVGVFRASLLTGFAGGLTLDSGGTGYAVNDIVTVDGGNLQGRVQVLTIGGGGTALTIQVVSPGLNYIVGTGIPTTSGGAGTGLTVNINVVGEAIGGPLPSPGLLMVDPGMNYAANDLVYVGAGNALGEVKILTVTPLTAPIPGQVLTYMILQGGNDYQYATNVPTATYGAGSGLTFDVMQVAGGVPDGTGQITFMVLAVDTADSSYRGLGSLGGSNPANMTPTFKGASRTGQVYSVGDYFIWSKTYEICQIIQITDAGEWTVLRAQFGSSLGASDIFYRCETWWLSAESAPKWQFAFANKTIVAISAGGPASPYQVNLAPKDSDPLPHSIGLETLNGACYCLGNLSDPVLSAGKINGLGAVTAPASVADMRVQVASWESIRLIAGTLKTAATGGSSGVQVWICYITPDLSTVCLVDVIYFGTDLVVSYLTGSGGLEGRQMPFHNTPWAPAGDVEYDWPPNMLPQLVNAVIDPITFLESTIAAGGILSPLAQLSVGLPGIQFSQYGLLDFIVMSVGTTIPGAGLGVQVFT